MNLKPEDDFEMEDEYDFSNAERGKFYSPNSTYTYPIYFDFDVLKYFDDLAESRGVDTPQLLHEILRRHMAETAAAADSGSPR
jgi:hypothetical protein